MDGRPSLTHYQLLEVAPDCTLDELRSAYRRLARRHHPDVADPSTIGSMAALNEAWRILSDEQLRRRYDNSMSEARVPAVVVRSSPRSQPPGARRQAWSAGVQAQMARLARQAGRSATQTLLIRAPRGNRSAYEAVVDGLVVDLSEDVESRIRSARAAGAAPLDLGVAATLVGIRIVADRMRRAAPLGVSTEALMAAELLDRMWDVLAHELPSQLSGALGGNPQVARAIIASQ